MDYIQYILWPQIKLKLIYCYWIIKYGGKKNVPKEVIFERMSKSLERLNENLQEALKNMPEEWNKEQKNSFHETIAKAQDLEHTAKKIFKEKNDIQ